MRLPETTPRPRAAHHPHVDVSAQRGDVNAFLATANAREVARRAVMWSRVDLTVHPALVNGATRMVASHNGVVFTIASVIVRNGKIAEMDFLADPERLAQLDLTILYDAN